jgi:hypothetical protein
MADTHLFSQQDGNTFLAAVEMGANWIRWLIVCLQFGEIMNEVSNGQWPEF